MAGARHGMCELPRHGMAGELHGMCELAFILMTLRVLLSSPSHSYDVTIHIYLHTALDAEQQLHDAG
jgi:hypothetical protein